MSTEPICHNPNSTQPNTTNVGFDMKMTLNHHHRELNFSNISAVTNPIITDPIITRTSLSIMTITKTKAVAIATTTKPSQLDFHDVIFHDVIFHEVISYYNTIVDHICL